VDLTSNPSTDKELSVQRLSQESEKSANEKAQLPDSTTEVKVTDVLASAEEG